MFYDSLTDAELCRVVFNDPSATTRELILVERLRRALAECDDLRKEIESMLPYEGED